MPKRFKFLINDEVQFSCFLQSVRCEADSISGDRCRNKTVIGTGLCWRHLLREKKVRIKNSDYGLGLFAMDTTAEENGIVFRENQTIVKYNGEIINREQLQERYGDHTAPYGAQMREHNRINDGACRRGVGTLVNHGNANRENAKFSFSRNGDLQIKATKIIRNGREIFINYNKGNQRGDARYLFDEPGVRHTTK
jgi:hypothetical protein